MTCPYIVFAFNPLFGEEGNVPERHEGSSQFSKCLVVDFVFVFAFAFALVFAVGGGPRWARYEKSCFLYNKIPHFRLFEARLLRRAEFGSPTKNDFFHALRGVVFFGVPFLLDKQKKRYDFSLF